MWVVLRAPKVKNLSFCARPKERSPALAPGPLVYVPKGSLSARFPGCLRKKLREGGIRRSKARPCKKTEWLGRCSSLLCSVGAFMTSSTTNTPIRTCSSAPMLRPSLKSRRLSWKRIASWKDKCLYSAFAASYRLLELHQANQIVHLAYHSNQ